MSTWPTDQVMYAGEALAQTFSAGKAELTMVETSLWAEEIERLGPAAMINFLKFWLRGSTQGSFRRAPTIEDFRGMADPSHVSASAAVEVLRKLVSTVGPYESPVVQDHKMAEAIHDLGGWSQVCAEMPDPADDFAYRRFSERVKIAWKRSEGLEVQQRLNPSPVLGLLDAPSTQSAFDRDDQVQISHNATADMTFSPSVS